MSKRVVFAEKIGDGKFIQVDNHTSKAGCAKYIAFMEKMLWTKPVTGGGGGGGGVEKPHKITEADIFSCGSYAKVLFLQMEEMFLRIAKTELQKQAIKKLGRLASGGPVTGGQKYLSPLEAAAFIAFGTVFGLSAPTAGDFLALIALAL